MNDLKVKQKPADIFSRDTIDKTSKVVKFYKNKNVLVTGASGFLGKVLLWKLLYTCKDINKIYVLLRSKNDCSAEKRLAQMLKAKPFSDTFQLSEIEDKVQAIESDITQPNLGLSGQDYDLLINEINIVIHSAASVKFEAPMKDNLRDNVVGVRSMVQLCNQIKNLNALVHVSTAYSNCQARDIKEELQPLESDIDRVYEDVQSMDDETCERLTKKMLEGRPNTYTYTKAMAEHFVARNEGKYPICIVRPSIVISSTFEPCFGWVDNVNGIAGLGCLASIGLLRTIDWNYYATSDMVPVDLVANCLICSAYQVYHQSPKKLLIYNMTSGNMNPISWGRFFEMLRDEATVTPSNKVVRPIIKSPKYNRANPISFTLTKYLSELLFAYTVDFILTLIGYKKILVKITKKMHQGYQILKPFTTNEWNFTSDNVMRLSESLSEVDRKMFPFDMRGFDWMYQAKATWHGGRTFILKEEACRESYETARTRLRLVNFVHYTFLAIGILLISLLAYNMTRPLRIFQQQTII